MTHIKYKNKKDGGMPVSFPIGAKQKSAITHTKKANPYLEMSDEEATKLVILDPQNFEIADAEEVAKASEKNSVAPAAEAGEEAKPGKKGAPKAKKGK